MKDNYTFVAQTIYTLVTLSQLKQKNFLDFSSAWVKIYEVDVNLEFSSSWIFISHFIVIAHNSTEIWSSYIFYFGQNDLIKVPILTLVSALVKICKIPHVIFQAQQASYSSILHHSSVSWKIIPLYFLAQTVYTLLKRTSLKSKFLRLSCARVKFCQIPYPILKRQDDSSLNFVSLFSFMKDKSSVLL